MKIYTSYFAVTKSLIKANIKPIGISLYPPQWYLMSGQTNMQILAPTREILALKSNSMYTQQFNIMLDSLDADNIFRAIGDLAKDRDCALLCFERPGEFCHRRLVAKWLESHLGIEVPEWRDTSKPHHLAAPSTPSTPTLFD